MFIFLLKINNLLHGAYRQSVVATLQLLIQGLTKRRKEKERKEKKRKKNQYIKQAEQTTMLSNIFMERKGIGIELKKGQQMAQYRP